MNVPGFGESLFIIDAFQSPISGKGLKPQKDNGKINRFDQKTKQ
jgi:hypothetical protein